MNAKRITVFAVALTMLVSALAFTPAASARVWVRGGVQVYAPPPPLRHEVVIARPGPAATCGCPGTGTGSPTAGTTSGSAADGFCRPIRGRSGSGRAWPTATTTAIYYRGYWRH